MLITLTIWFLLLLSVARRSSGSSSVNSSNEISDTSSSLYSLNIYFFLEKKTRVPPCNFVEIKKNLLEMILRLLSSFTFLLIWIPVIPIFRFGNWLAFPVLIFLFGTSGVSLLFRFIIVFSFLTFVLLLGHFMFARLG